MAHVLSDSLSSLLENDNPPPPASQARALRAGHPPLSGRDYLYFNQVSKRRLHRWHL